MSKTSDRAEVLSLAIARHFEKEPTWSAEPLIPMWLTSDGGFWLRWTGEEMPNTQPRSITEPEIAMKLLGILFRRSGFTDVGRLISDQSKMDRPSEIAFSDWWTDERIKVAIAEAVVKAFNLEVG